MIPETAQNPALAQDFQINKESSLTYKLNSAMERAVGYTEGIEAVKQAVYKILLTERYDYIIYSGNYGIELKDLFGQPVTYVCPELERRIKEALTWDNRIESVTDFKFDLRDKGTVAVSFTVNCIFGSFVGEKEVKI